MRWHETAIGNHAETRAVMVGRVQRPSPFLWFRQIQAGRGANTPGGTGGGILEVE
jgi:hypothetical protein